VEQITDNRISTILKKLSSEVEGREHVSIEQIMKILQQYGFSLLMIMLAMPCVLPLPAISFVGGVPLIYFAVQILRGFVSPKIPSWLGNKQIKSEFLINVINKAVPYLEKFELFFKLKFPINNMIIATKLMGIFSLLFAIFITLPLPFGNSLPSLGIILMSIGLLNKDLILIIIGIFVGMIGVTLASSLVAGALHLLNIFIAKLYSFF
jgi:hypothetical protein